MASVTFSRIEKNFGNTKVLHGISLEIAPREVVALIGPNGCGKSTLLRVLAGLYDVQHGRFEVDDIARLGLQHLASVATLIPQDAEVFEATVRENLAFGEAVDAAAIEAAIATSGFTAVLETLPLGLDTPITERGMNLSGGQRQRLAIARAILCDPEIFVFDEATSHLDTRTERAIQGTLREALRGRTTLMVAHRLSTIKNADLIYVVADGQVIEWGTHAELLRENGAYWMLWRAQADAATEPGGRNADEGLEPIVMVSAPEAQRVRRIPVAVQGGAHAHRTA